MVFTVTLFKINVLIGNVLAPISFGLEAWWMEAVRPQVNTVWCSPIDRHLLYLEHRLNLLQSEFTFKIRLQYCIRVKRTWREFGSVFLALSLLTRDSKLQLFLTVFYPSNAPCYCTSLVQVGPLGWNTLPLKMPPYFLRLVPAAKLFLTLLGGVGSPSSLVMCLV